MKIFRSSRLSNRNHVNLLSVFLVCIALLILTAGCDSDDPTSEPAPQQPNNSGGNSSGSGNQPQTGTAELTLSNVSITGVDSQLGSPYYQFEGTVHNRGNADASGFEAGCTYQCPGGQVISGGFDLVQGGFISANDSRTYTNVNRIACEPVPALLFDVTCEVDGNNDVIESNENNNTFTIGQFSVP